MTKRTMIITGLVVIALIAAGALAALAMAGDEPSEPQAYTVVDNGHSIELAVGESFTVILEGNPTTGYGWQVQTMDETVLAGSEPEYVTDSQALGSGGMYTFTFTGVTAGETQLELAYARSWESVPPLQTFTLTVIVH
jgi:predicted secreted protein